MDHGSGNSMHCGMSQSVIAAGELSINLFPKNLSGYQKGCSYCLKKVSNRLQRRQAMFYRAIIAIMSITLAVGSSACSIKKFAINKVGDALASGGSTYTSDDDVELVAGALPFSLKLVESLIAESPKHKGLRMVAAQGFASYAYIEVQPKIDRAMVTDIDEAQKLKARARRLYMRGHKQGLAGLEISHRDFAERLAQEPRRAVADLKKKDVPLIYWTAAGLGMAISTSKDDPAMIARIPEVEALIDRALELDPGWDKGSLHEFFIQLAASKPGKLDVEQIQNHFEKALELSKGKKAGLFVTYAEALAIPQQNREEFIMLLEKALAIDPDDYPDGRLLNIIAQRRARWLLDRVDDLILVEEEPAEGE
jgi:predicted anti-sigma-YlaC factor YlaD